MREKMGVHLYIERGNNIIIAILTSLQRMLRLKAASRQKEAKRGIQWLRPIENAKAAFQGKVKRHG